MGSLVIHLLDRSVLLDSEFVCGETWKLMKNRAQGGHLEAGARYLPVL